MDKLLEGWEKIKKDKHGHSFYYKRKHFSMIVFPVDGVMGKEALVLLATLSQLVTAKMN